MDKEHFDKLRHPIIIYDGVCGLCNRFVSFVIRHDRKGKFRFAPLQGSFSLSLTGLPPCSNQEIETVYLYESGKLHIRSRAALRILQLMGFPWNLMQVFSIIPVSIADSFYCFVSKNRYRWFGKYDSCKIPDPALRSKFYLD